MKEDKKIGITYYLKNKDEIVLSFKYVKIVNNYAKIKIPSYSIEKIKVVNKKLLPTEFLADYGGVTLNKPNFKIWLKSRKAPTNRKNVDQIKKYQEILNNDGDLSNDILDYIKLSYGLGLNDSYWILPEEKKEYRWGKYNLYDNKFDDVLALIAIGDRTVINSDFSNIKNAIRLSPEYTTDGMLAKCWAIISDEISLLKKSSANHKKEAYTEFYMTQVLDVLEFSHIEYDIIKYNENIVSKCPLFTNEDIGFVPMYKCFKANDKILDNKIQLLEKIREIMGDKSLNDILVFDALIGNTDRHLGNFGMLRDNNTGKILSPAPIFDNGTSFMSLNYDSIEDFFTMEKTRFNLSFKNQGRIFVEERHRPMLEKLTNFKFKRHPKYNLDDRTIQLTEKFIRHQSKTLLAQLEDNKEK